MVKCILFSFYENYWTSRLEENKGEERERKKKGGREKKVGDMNRGSELTGI